MSNEPNNSHTGLVAGIASALPLGVVLGWSVFDHLLVGVAAALTIGVFAGLLADWRLGPR